VWGVATTPKFWTVSTKRFAQVLSSHFQNDVISLILSREVRRDVWNRLQRFLRAALLTMLSRRRGELKAVAPLIKVIDRLDKHQETVVAKYNYGPEERQPLLDKVNRLVDNLQPADGEAAELTGDGDENTFAEIPS
jgi:hypothetical protein